MPTVEIDGTNSTVKTNVLTSQSGTAITVPTGKVLTVTDAAGLTVAGTAVTPASYLSAIPDNSVTGAKLNISLLAGDTMYASGTDTLAKLAKGTAGQVLTMNGGATAPAWADAAAGGKLLQVVSVTNNTYTATTSTSWVTTNLTASITPSATSSKIFIIANLTLYFAATGDTPGMTIFRGTVSGTNLADASHGFAYHDIASTIGSGTRTGSLGLNYLDSPSTSSAQVYTIGMRSNAGANTIKGSNGEHATMTLMEIGA